jgi:gliding motility-associated lipoprotein GldJ
LGATVATLVSCQKERSPVTAWEYNNPKNGGFEVVPYEEQETGPGLVLVQGGTFTMGRAEQDVTYDWNTIPRRVTVSSFYMDQTEVRNLDYLEYLYWTNNVFGPNYYDVVKKAMPDTLVWRDRLAYNEPYVEYYLRHPSYRDYPVVGINWLQASDFCAWRTDRVNEFILIREGILEHNPTPDENVYLILINI